MPVIPSWVNGDWQAGTIKDGMKEKRKGKDRKASPVTEEELKMAIGKFVKSGGIIRKLPAQKSGKSRLVGKKWGHTEMGSDQPS
ncbi:MAG: hypothetical protein IIC13_01730 [SAR324 cluster bacterium]|nr:hypothetical protein [SAR324 cluster bacterium]MCH8885286.1 hypothetical protein [SAR324 cluster bacterium]